MFEVFPLRPSNKRETFYFLRLKLFSVEFLNFEYKAVMFDKEISSNLLWFSDQWLCLIKKSVQIFQFNDYVWQCSVQNSFNSVISGMFENVSVQISVTVLRLKIISTWEWVQEGLSPFCHLGKWRRLSELEFSLIVVLTF